MEDYIWCRLRIDEKTYYYVHVPKQQAMVLCMKQGYEIKVNPPPKNEQGYHQHG